MTPETLDSNLRAGDHLCAIYDTDAEWLGSAVPYFREGLARREACVYVASEKNSMHLEVALRAAGIDVDAQRRRGALRFATPEATYLRPGHFDPDVMIALWQELIDAASAEGYTNLRVAGSPTWINEGIPGAERWAEYEAQINEFFRGRRAIKLCQYDRRLFSPTVLLDVLRSHPFAVVHGAVHANPFAGMANARAESDHLKLDHDLADALTRERAARLAAEAACRKKDEFIAVFSHELRTPLASAVVAAALIERLSSNDPRAATAREVLGRQLDQARRLVDDLLDVERVSTGKVELSADRVDLAQLVRDGVAAILVPTHEFRVDARPAWVIGDAARLQQVVGNLITNATKHTPAGGRIALSVVEDGADVVLRVDDSGAGMPPDLVGRVFDTFVQGPTPRTTAKGLGLGLSVVRRLVELHGGRVEALSDGPGRGSRFIVRLPAAPSASPEAPVSKT
jgi:signal transduction histidine kinase